jgi:hypothetical protein
MSEALEQICARFVAAKQVGDDDVAALRKLIWNAEAITPPVVDQLFAINDALTAPFPAFSDLFGEVITHFLLRQEWPHDFISDANALWLETRVGRDSRIESHAELELMIRVLEKAENAPEHLKTWTLAQIENCVVTGRGPTRSGAELRPGTIESCEVVLLRRLIFASGGASSLSVSEAEADLLFRIKDATKGQDNAPEFATLFVQCVANHLMSYSSRKDISLDRALELNSFMDHSKPNVSGFLSRVFSSSTLRSIVEEPTASEPVNHDAAVADAARIAGDEAAWLKRQIVADSQIDAMEQAVLAFIVDEGVELPGTLDGLRSVG